MLEQLPIFTILRPIFFWSSPVILFVGVFLLLSEFRYRRLEEVLGKEIGSLKKIAVPKLEVTIYTFQERLLHRRGVVGSVLIMVSLLFLFIFKS